MVAALLHSGGDGLARACARAGCVVLVVVLCGARSRRCRDRTMDRTSVVWPKPNPQDFVVVVESFLL